MEAEGERAYLSYKNDSGEIVSTYINLIKVTDSYIEFQTKQNIILIPMNRVLKLKRDLQ